MLWVRQEYDASGNQYHNFQYYAYDKAETACVQTYGRNYGGSDGGAMTSWRSSLTPFRGGRANLYVRVQEQGNGGQEMSDQKFVISNPARGSFAKWTAEPAAQHEGGRRFVGDADQAVGRRGHALPARTRTMPMTPRTRACRPCFTSSATASRSRTGSRSPVETTDATGNRRHLARLNGNNWQDGDDTVTYQYGLWPDEPAWKIKFEFSQQSDFADSESWKVQNLPVLPGRQQEMYNYGGNRRAAMTNAPVAETDLNGFHLKLFPAKDFTDAGQGNWMQGGVFVEASPAVGDGWRMTVKVTDTQTNDIQSSQYNVMQNNNVSSFRYRLQDISGLTNLNVTIALHKSRFVEFTAKPEKSEVTAAQ